MAFTFLGAVIFPIAFYWAGGLEKDNPSRLWAILSAVISLVVLSLRTGPMGLVLGQVGLYIGITLYRAKHKA
jgi:hypothetical protein